MIRKVPGIDITLQQNKAVNIDLAGKTFSFWKNVGPTTQKEDTRMENFIPGSGGDLCDQANTLHLLVLESPLTVTELHFHSDVLTLDEELGVPFSSGTSVEYNNVDYRFVNDTGQDFQLLSWCEGEMHYAQLRCEHEIPYYYRLVEEDHHFAKEKDKYYRISKIYRETYDKANGSLVKKGFIRDNHSEVMFDPSLIPPSLLRQ